jgi:hypothetical protein
MNGMEGLYYLHIAIVIAIIIETEDHLPSQSLLSNGTDRDKLL